MDANMVTTPEVAQSNLKTQLEHFEQMVRIRLFEERVLRLHSDGQIVGSVHLCNGQEAIPVGARSALSPGDPVFATYRGHGYAIACGTPLEPLFAELLGRQSGVCGGRGGSAFLSAPQYDFYGENSIVGAGAPIATGAALAAWFDRSSRVVLSVFGEGAMNQGAVHEAMNFAASMDLPVLFLCENNHYSELTPTASTVRADHFYERATSYGFPGIRVDGNDPQAVHDAVAEATSLARRGGGPTLIEAMTQRIVGHYIGDPQHYRPVGELDLARQDEPIARLHRQLVETGQAAAVRAITESVQGAVDAAAASALAAPVADASSARAGVYA